MAVMALLLMFTLHCC